MKKPKSLKELLSKCELTVQKARSECDFEGFRLWDYRAGAAMTVIKIAKEIDALDTRKKGIGTDINYHVLRVKMKFLYYRIKVTYWLIKLGGFSAIQAWRYSEGFKESFYEIGGCDLSSAKDDVIEDFSYYSE